MYTFYINMNLLFCMISHIASLTCDDDTYLFPGMAPQTVLTLSV